MTFRKIIHVDMDAFYASIEQRDNPQYRNRPIVVGGLPDQRGVVAAASYEARAFGIHSAMSSRRALELCPEIIFVRPRFEIYKQVSNAIRSIFSRYTDLIEPLSLDEAYLDVTQDKLAIGSAIDIAMEIKKSIHSELNLTASAGISTNKFVAKIASDINKPDGLTFIGPSKIESFIEHLAIEKFHGVGKVTASKMKGLNIFNGADLKRLSRQQLIQYFGKVGNFYYDIVRGIDNRPVEPYRELKSIGAEDTFKEDLYDVSLMLHELNIIVSKVQRRLASKQVKGHTVTLKIKFSDFKQITRNYTHVAPIQLEEIEQFAIDLLKQAPIDGKGIRLLGVTISNFNPYKNNLYQLSLF
ncbi:DNA polymerase IV [Olivibacter domesticus]|uniref:DNA polymerase IV n=1 Tax=Olivibacter domesticus TaxID=407022 RepID=A0A1H7PBL4_OLID1|nr:DNA polymerase IV [Olivibacter domesticus]SEL32814.1 DNA polymerase-4 [Olivibacter domesticus]